MELCRDIIDGFNKTETEKLAKDLSLYKKIKDGTLKCSLSEIEKMKEQSEISKSKLLRSDFLIVSMGSGEKMEDKIGDSIVKNGNTFSINLFCSFSTLAKHLKQKRINETIKPGNSNTIGIAIHKSSVHIVSFEDALNTVLKFEKSGGEKIEINIICEDGKVTIR